MNNSEICSNQNNNIINSLCSCFFSLDPKQYALLSSLLGLLLIENLSLDQQNSLGNFIVSLGSAILTSAAQGQFIEANRNNQIQQKIEILKGEIHKLEQSQI